MLPFCPWDAPQLFLISENTPPYLLYSHGIALVSALLFGILVFYKNRTLLNSILFFIISAFSLWTLFDLMQWATNRPDVLLFFWSVNIILELLIYSAAFYLCSVFIHKHDLSVGKKILLFSPILLMLALLPTRLLLSGVDIGYCNAVESPLVILYTYALQALIILSIFFFAAIALQKKTSVEKKESWLFVAGIIVFLLAFSSGNIIGSLTENWELAQYGLFGMPIFIGFLAYCVVRYRSFNVKMLGVQALVSGLAVLVLSLLFVRTIERVQIITAFTFVIVCGVGYALVRSVKKEIEQREQVEILAQKLEVSNEKLQSLDKLKTEFLSLASHQLRSPLTAIKGYASMLAEGAFGKMTAKQDEGVKRIYSSAQGLVNIVEDLLNVSKIEQGGMKYELQPTDLTPIVTALYNEMKIPAEAKGLVFTLDIPNHDVFMAIVDPLKIKQVFLNLTDNSIKYTPSGFVKLFLSRKDDTILFSVADTGVGITPETKEKLFEKFSRGEGGKLNTGGSGLGLYLAQEITKAHKGRIVIESEGAGKGATFIVELPAAGAQVAPDVMPS
ncbi:MAG: sensor histidine kinase [Minisyncoccia bacterium]